MKTKGTCPKCECRRLFVIESVAQKSHRSSNGIIPMSVTTVRVGSFERADIGHLETWICSRCGCVEWYAMDAVPSLERWVAKGGEGVRLVDAETAPYR